MFPVCSHVKRRDLNIPVKNENRLLLNQLNWEKPINIFAKELSIELLCFISFVKAEI